MKELSLLALRSFSGVGAVEPSALSTALLIIDMQNGFLRADGFTIRRLRERGLDEAVRQYESQLHLITPNLARLVGRAREHGQMIIFVNTVNTPGRQSGGQTINQWIPRDSDEAEITPALAMQPEDLLVTKTCSGVFAGTNLDFLLRRRGITNLIVGGVVTDGCVEQAIRQAHDLGYACVLLSDGSAALTDEIHLNALERLAHRRAHVLPTEHVYAGLKIPATEIAPRGTVITEAAVPSR